MRPYAAACGRVRPRAESHPAGWDPEVVVVIIL